MTNRIAILFAGIAVFAIALLGSGAPAKVSAWEKANGYPFGQMCNSIFTGYVNTCPAAR